MAWRVQDGKGHLVRLSSLHPVLVCLLGVLLLGTVGTSGCATENPGVTPSRDTFYFPTGLAMDPRRPVLYVTNSNADLRYNGGTLMALDLRALPADLSQVGALTESKRLDCRPDRVESSRWECPEAQFVQAGATLRIGDFPSEVRVTSDGERLFVPVRGQNYLLWARITELAGGGVDLRCDDSPDTGCGQAGKTDCPAWDCAAPYRVKFSDRLQRDLATEPFGIYVNELAAVHIDAKGGRRTCRDGGTAMSCTCGAAARRCDPNAATPRDCCLEAPPLNHVYLAHLAGGEVSYFASTPSGVEFRDQVGGFFTSSGSVRGGFNLAATVPGDAGSPVLVSSRVDSVLGSFVIRGDLDIVPTPRQGLGVAAPGNDLRGVAVGPGGTQLFVVNRAPPSLIALERNERLPDRPFEPLWEVEVCSEPSLLRLGADPARPGDPTARLAFVVCFRDAEIFVVDVGLGKLVGRIPTGRGPNALELDPARRRAFIANFADNTVGVIDLDPSHRTYLQMMLRIGLVRRIVEK
ncbi:MAG: hypothetical protein IT371_02725 [Deltaproteobacteria bacterium]|nr:hypothetical protein [Deltaproteobacteria bacterium]